MTSAVVDEIEAEKPEKLHDDKEGEELLKILEQFSDRLGAVEKDVLDSGGANRRRRTVEERPPATVIQVNPEVSGPPDEATISHRRSRVQRKPRSGALKLAQLIFLALVAVLMYFYWHKISRSLRSYPWRPKTVAESRL